MAIPTNTFATGSAIGNREDLTDTIYRIDPTDTPFYSGIERVKATAVLHEWQTQALAAASNSNFQSEGDDVAADATTATTRLTNRCQISRKAARVSGTQRVVDHAGRDDEMDYQVMLKGLELKRDIETTLCGTNQAKASTDPRKIATYLSWIKTNTDKGTGGTDPTAADGTSTRVDGTQRAFTEAQVKNVLQKCYAAGGKPKIIQTGSFNKQVFSTFTGRGTPTEDQSKQKITAAVDTYISDFGTLKVLPDLFQRSRDVLIYQDDMWAYATLTGRSMVSFPIAKTGDSDAKAILSEYSLEARQEASSGGVFDLTSS